MLAAIGPGLLLAATGVGGGDLATGTFVGSLLGTSLLWAVVVGAFMKYVITEGVARWQLATGNTFLEGVFHKGGPVVIWAFLPYLLLFTFFVGGAQMSACGVALVALFPVFDNPDNGKVVFGIACSAVGVAMVLIGGYRLFEQVMRVCIGVMFVTVVLTAVLLWPGTGVVLRGLLVPTIPDFSGLGLTWTVALIGGIGGTVTMLCYGYWMREEGRTDPDELRVCRIDLGAGYFMTALFGIAMVIIGSTIEIEGQGTTLLGRSGGSARGPARTLGPVAVPDRRVRRGLQQPPRGLAVSALYLRRLLGARARAPRARCASDGEYLGVALSRLPAAHRYRADGRTLQRISGRPAALHGDRRPVPAVRHAGPPIA